MHIHLIFLFGALVAGAAFSGLLFLARRHPTWAFPALMLFLIGTQPLGYLIWGEPLASTYYLGWLAGLTPCLAYRLWCSYRKTTT